MDETAEERLNILEPACPGEQEFHSLDPRAVKLWRTANLIASGVVLLVLLLGALPVALKLPMLGPWLLGCWAMIALVCVWLSWQRPPRVFRAWQWRIDARVLEVRSGLLFQRTNLLPLSRLQHVDLERGPLERRFGLASLVLHTAGTHSASITIPGLDANEAVSLRDHLIEIGGDDAV